MTIFQQNTLWDRVQSTTREALRRGALEPIATRFQFLEDQDVRFLVRIVAKLARKPRMPRGDYNDATQPNPFLPCDRQLYVADASKTHICVLNKYNVVDHHLLVVTRRFEHQESPLNQDDFHALWRCMLEYDALGFYNSGTDAGASQSHKHLQVVPLPLAPDGPSIPIESLLNGAKPTCHQITRAGHMPFLHALVHWNDTVTPDAKTAARVSWELYQQMLEQVGLHRSSHSSERVSGPYNLLVSRRWMLLVPRQEECFHSISLNALAFAGALLVRDEKELDQLKTAGPFTALKTVTRPLRGQEP